MPNKVGFVGLGTMGKWMALNLLKKQKPLWVYDLQPEVVEELQGQGARAASSILDLGEKCDVIILCLPDAKVVDEALFGRTSLKPSLRAGMTIIDCSTTDASFARDIEKKLRKRGITFLDAPISGMASKVREGRLTIMVGGDRVAFEKVRPLLAAMGNTIAYLGGPGNGQLTKTLNNVLFNISCAAMAEILPLAVKMGIAPEEFCKVIASSSGQSYGFDFFAPLVLKRDFGPGYSMNNAYKDMANLNKLTAQQQIPLPVAAATMQTYQMALASGHGQENKGAMVKVWEAMHGVVVKKS